MILFIMSLNMCMDTMLLQDMLLTGLLHVASQIQWNVL